MRARENKIEKQSKKNIFNSESAAATVIAAVLLLSLIFTVLAFVKVAYVPEWKSDAEILHMSQVQKDMIELKSMTDLTSSLMVSDPDYSSHSFFLSIPFNMGGGEIPILEPSKSSGTLSVNTQPCKIKITFNNISTSNEIPEIDCGGITYFSNNEEYVDQTYRYENGAVIICQGNKSLMRNLPNFINVVTENKGNSYNFSIQTISIIGNLSSISSNSDISLRIKGHRIHDYGTYKDNITSFNCTISTEYPDAWDSYLKQTAKQAGLSETEYRLGNDSSSSPSTVYFEFPAKNSSKTIERLDISESLINATWG